MSRQRSKETEWERRALIVKPYELLCYRSCYYLLQCEAEAMQAALACMEQVMRDDAFFQSADLHRQTIVRKTAIRCSLQLARSRGATSRHSHIS
ncbi:hypothetical protein N0M98_01420 [Paenibacillus doosanensis]|uniref:hypothetical protein n=1 Tax=Paenibacillus doosanensis TaxID=1229154 RepID=UPI00218099A8|nr:hypothetical protein [Paenibacillus doosanensis]MCS7458785.1 hypothetical protein [Paenibacillus doosanensis]